MMPAGDQPQGLAGRAQRWADAYAAAWRAGDAEAAAELFTEDCVMRSHPFRPIEDARAYTRQAFAIEEGREVWFGLPVVDGDRASVEYWCAMVEDGKEVTLAGHCLLRLGPDGRCAELRDYWAMRPGLMPPPEPWGR